MFYGLCELINNVVSLIYTKIFWKKARLVRMPFRARNKKNIFWGRGFTCGQFCRITAGGDENGRITIGKNFVMGDMCQIEGQGGIVIGDNVLFASRIFVGTASHGEYSLGTEQSSPYTSPRDRQIILKSIVIGDNVWIGNSVSILGGVTIGKGSVIGAGSVVTCDIPENVVAVGVPSKVIKIWNDEKKMWISNRNEI